MRFKGLDLNLLVALDVLLDERSVSVAAKRLHLTQPAMSAALGRIREYFNDPILALHGKRMVPTPHAIKIHSELKDLLSSLDVLISKTTSFDPETSTRKFKITASDYLAQIIFVPLLRELRSIAPNIQLEILSPVDSTITLISQGQLDFVLLPEQYVSKELPSEFLLEERFVVVGCKDNPIMKRKLTEDEFYNSSHIVTKLGRVRPESVSDQGLEVRKKIIGTDIVVNSFLLAPEMVVGTNRLTVMHERLARVFATRLPIAMAEMPFPFPPLREYVQYHSTRTDDFGLMWMIDKIRQHIN